MVLYCIVPQNLQRKSSQSALRSKRAQWRRKPYKELVEDDIPTSLHLKPHLHKQVFLEICPTCDFAEVKKKLFAVYSKESLSKKKETN